MLSESSLHHHMNSKLFPAAMLLAVLAGCKPSEPSVETQTASGSAPTTATVKRQDLVGYSFFDGKMVVPASAQATAFSPYDTPVVSVSTEIGKYVERGEPIVKLTIPGADQATTVAKLNANSANANLSSQKSIASTPVKDAQEALDQAKTAEKIAQETVAQGGTADVAAATQTRVDAETALKNAQQQMNSALQPAQDAASLSAAQLQTIKEDAAKGVVRAPISGTIVSLDAKPGMDAQAKQALATILDYGSVRVQGIVPPELKDTVVRHVHVIIATDGQSSEPIEGEVTRVSVVPPAAGQSSSGYLAEIRFLKPRSVKQPGMNVKRIGVKSGVAKQALVVPVAAVSTKDGKSTVNLQSGSNWVSTPVETGLTDGTVIEIKSGLSEGAIVQVPSTTSN
jgi:hypothetical protein